MITLKLADGLSLPIEAVTEKLGFLGRTGSGKTYAALKLAEEMHRAGAQFVAVDPVGKWWSLRLAANGKDPGLAIPVFGGLQGDIPIEPGGGKLLADVIVDRGVSAVLDVSQFESDAAKARFAADFADRLFFRKKAVPTALHLFLEEAQEFVPQNPQRDETRMLHVWTRIQKLGRNFGIGTSLLSQRPQEVNKKVLNQTELLFVFQLTGPQERKAIAGWISEKGIDADIEAELPKLARGRPHAWSPAWLNISKVVTIAPRTTFDASSTPKVGARTTEKPLAPIDLVKLRTDMAATIERAKAEDPKELRRQLAERDRELRELRKVNAAHAGVQTAAKVELKRVEVPVLKEGQLARFEKVMGGLPDRLAAALSPLTTLHDRVHAAVDPVLTVSREIAAALRTLNGNGHRAPAPLPTIPARPLPTRPVPVSASIGRGAKENRAPAEGITKGQQKLLNALAELEVLGVEAPTRHQLGMVAGYNLTGGSGAQHIADLAAAGMVSVGAGVVSLIDTGRAAADPADAPTTLDELHQRVLAKLSAGQRRIAEHLIAIYPDPMSRAELGAAVGYNLTGGSGAQHVADLITVGAARIPIPGKVAASDLLFPASLLENR